MWISLHLSLTGAVAGGATLFALGYGFGRFHDTRRKKRP